MPAGSVAGESFLPDCRQLSSSSSPRALIPLWGPALMTSSRPITSQRPHLLLSSHWGFHQALLSSSTCPRRKVTTCVCLAPSHPASFLGGQEFFHHPQATMGPGISARLPKVPPVWATIWPLPLLGFMSTLGFWNPAPRLPSFPSLPVLHRRGTRHTLLNGHTPIKAPKFCVSPMPFS